VSLGRIDHWILNFGAYQTLDFEFRGVSNIGF